MPDQDDFPRCETCEHFDVRGQGRCWHDEINRAATTSLRRPRVTPDPDFGCILHSELDSDE